MLAVLVHVLALGPRASAATPVTRWDLETDDGGFVSAGDPGQWAWGPVASGPGAGVDGANAWAIGLNGPYLNDALDALELPVPALTGLVRPTLSWAQWYDLDPGDVGWIEVDDGQGWAVVAPVYGYPTGAAWGGASDGWEDVVVDLRGYGDTPRVRWVFAADAIGVAVGWYVDRVAIWDGDVAPPALSGLSVLADTDDLAGPYPVSVTARDDTAVVAATLLWSTDTGASGEVAMTTTGDGTWTGDLPGQDPDTTVAYAVRASDGTNSATAPATPLVFRVRLPAPTDLEGPEDRVVGGSVALSWVPPTSAQEVTGYVVYRADTAVLEVGPVTTDGRVQAEVPLAGEADTFRVAARFTVDGVVWEGDRSDELAVDAVVPAVTEVSPAEGWPGDHLRLTVLGSYLLLVDGEVELDLGEGIDVELVDVRDVDALVAEIAVTEGAAPGARALTLTSATGTVTVPDAFTVLDGGDRPRLVSVSPDHVVQGDTEEFVIELVGALDGVPAVDLGDGLLIETVALDGDAVRAVVVCAPSAPIGDHALTLDDGVRRFDGLSVTVEDAVRPVSPTGCGLGLAAGIPGVLLALGVAASRRRPRG